ncbi:hypothetical protein MVEN_00633000 [Mycena venus]|uniref:Uncharacterized protein n=1 Tax=Mycena venus TaxID=2733690 RepID=A0A8H7D805_9AGAR|nr:hypothetical protein MVEN_00633000 [Mycena venus]
MSGNDCCSILVSCCFCCSMCGHSGECSCSCMQAIINLFPDAWCAKFGWCSKLEDTASEEAAFAERDREAALFQERNNTQPESIPAMNEKSAGPNIRDKSNIMSTCGHSTDGTYLQAIVNLFLVPDAWCAKLGWGNKVEDTSSDQAVIEERDYEASLFQAQNTQPESVPAMNEKYGGLNIRDKSNIMYTWMTVSSYIVLEKNVVAIRGYLKRV